MDATANRAAPAMTPTSATGNNRFYWSMRILFAISCAPAPDDAIVRTRRASAASGFTLLEMMVVIVLLALAAAALSTSTARGLAAAHAEKACSDTASLLRATRIEAMETGTTQQLEIDPTAHRLRDYRGHVHTLPRDLSMSVVGADELSRGGVTGIAFAADGSSSGGHVSLLRQRMLCRINVSWLTGATEIDKHIVTDTADASRTDDGLYAGADNDPVFGGRTGASFPGNAPGTP